MPDNPEKYLSCDFCGKAYPGPRLNLVGQTGCWECRAKYIQDLELAERNATKRWQKKTKKERQDVFRA